MDKTKYWVWLTNLPNITPEKVTSLLDRFGSVDEIYQAEQEDYLDIHGIGKREIMSLSYKDLSGAEKIIDRTLTAGARIIDFDSGEFPDCLRQIPAPPHLLYAKGRRMPWDKLLMIGVVGTRRCSEYGQAAAQRICHDLADAGVTIVSGMARGIDSQAAIAALRTGRQTVAVLGCGIDIVYPPENKDLMDEIIENGLVLTEYPPLSPAAGHHFPERNRIISGLSRGVLAVEAPERSGTLITAEYALNSGKDVFSIPGSIFKGNCRGTNRLIQQGAKLVMSAEDILEEYPYEMSLLQEMAPAPKQAEMEQDRRVTEGELLENERYKNLSDDEKCIMRLLLEKNMHIDDIVRGTGFAIGMLNPMLAMMEMMGHIRKLPGNHYRLNL